MPLQEKPINPSAEHKSTTHFNDWPNEAGFTASVEQRQPRVLTTSGEFPAYAAGSLFRTGPGTYLVDTKDKGTFACSHWFDGFTHIHKFDIIPKDNGSVGVEYTSRSQVDELLEKARTTGKLEGFTFGQKRDPCDSYFKKVKSAFQAARNTSKPGAAYSNIGVVVVNTVGKSPTESLTVTTDANAVKEFNPATLEPAAITTQRDLHPDLDGPLSGAHPGVDPVTGDVFNYNLKPGPKNVYRVFKTNAKTGKTEVLATFAEADIPGAYLHSIFITENYIVICVWPAYFAARGAALLWEQSILGAMRFDPSARTNWIVVDRTHGRGIVNRFKSDAMFAFHFVNGWEEKNDKGGTDIVCDLAEYKDMDILHKFYYENLVSSGPGVNEWTTAKHPSLFNTLKRYRLPSINADPKTTPSKPMAAARPAETVQSVNGKYAVDLPRINESLMTKRHRYIYGSVAKGRSSFVDELGKVDMDAPDPTASTIFWGHEKHSPGEPVFIAKPGGSDEDDGVVLSVVLNGETGTSYLLCLDAKTMQEVARAEVEAPVGFGFHGIHVSKEGV